MSGNCFGKIFRVTTFGESHGQAVGGVIDGCPAGMHINQQQIKEQLRRRQATSQRQETNEIVWLSGLLNGTTTGTPIAFLIPNHDIRPQDYQQEKKLLKPSHAHYVYWQKYGIFDHQGSGRASGRETAARVVAGCIAMQYLEQQHIHIEAYTLQIGAAKVEGFPHLELSSAKENILHCPNMEQASQMLAILDDCRQHGDSVGCKVGCMATGMPVGIGEPVFDKLSADLSKAMLSINAAKAFELGLGSEFANSYGSQVNDLYKPDFTTEHNYSGGITAGISTGEPIYFTTTFKPIPTIMQDQPTVDLNGQAATLQATGRHDICLCPRVLPVVEAMTALCLIDKYLEFKAYSK